MDPKVLGQLGDGKYLLIRRHSSSSIPPGKSLCAGVYRLIPWFSLLRLCQVTQGELFSVSARALHTQTCIWAIVMAQISSISMRNFSLTEESHLKGEKIWRMKRWKFVANSRFYG